MKDWCWHPKKRVATQPSEEDYRCYCGCCTSKCGFIFFTIVAILFYAFFGLVYLLMYMFASSPMGWIQMACSICLIMCAVLAIAKQELIHMQIYWVVSWVSSGIILFLNLLTLALLAYEANDAADKHMSNESQAKVWRMFYGQILVIIIQVIVYAWMLCITWSYYSYLRDRKLYEEQQGQQVNPNVVVYKTPASNNYPTIQQ